MPTLTKIAEVTLAGQTVHVSSNGSPCLVRNVGRDAYGTDIWQVIDTRTLELAETEDLVRLLLEAHLKLIDLTNELNRAHMALQREANEAS